MTNTTELKILNLKETLARQTRERRARIERLMEDFIMLHDNDVIGSPTFESALNNLVKGYADTFVGDRQ